MIPYAILSGKLIWENQNVLDIRVLDLSLDGFTFRIAKKYVPLEKVQAFCLSFFQFASSEYISLEISDFTICKEEETTFFQVYRVLVENDSFSIYSRRLMQEYMQYIDLKFAGDDAELSRVLVGYPKEEEELFPSSVVDWRAHISNRLKEQFLQADDSSKSSFTNNLPLSKLEFAIELDSDEIQDKFLTCDFEAFTSWYWNRQGLEWHPLAKVPISCVYIGSQYCMHLFPEEEHLLSLLNRAISLHLTPVLVFPPMKSKDFNKIKHILVFLSTYYIQHEFFFSGFQMELILNDWGMIHYLASHQQMFSHFSLTLGILLNKRRKDTRLPYKNGCAKQLELLKQNNSNADFYEDYLRNTLGISRFSYESCGYDYQIADGSHILHLPLFQMNTAGHCTLYAACQNGDRGIQTTVESCPKYCQRFAFLYPSMLSMVGIKNSLFGYDPQFLCDGNNFSELLRGNIRRIVFSFP